MNKHILFSIALSLCAPLACANLLYDIVDGKYRPASIPGTTSCANGENYLQTVDNKLIVRYAYQTGEAIDTIFNAEKTKLQKIKSIDGFILDPTEKRLLVYNNRKQIYRHSFTADYYIFDITRNELKPLSDTLPVQVPLFSPNGRYIAFARNNNLFIHKIDFNTEVAVTTDGAIGKIINGTPDWLYEEEFGTTQLFCWSPDSKLLAFVKFDETNVPSFSFQTFLDSENAENMKLYPDLYTFKYPKAGEQNAKVSACVYDTYYKSIKVMDIEDNGKDFYIPRIRWTNSPDQLAIFKLNRNQTQLQMLLANPKSTVSKLIYNESADVYVDYEQIDDWYFLSDNSFIAINETDGFRHAYLYSPLGLKQKQLTQGNYDVTHIYGYNEDNQTLYYQSCETSPMQRNVYALNLKKNKTTRLTQEAGTHNAVFSAGFKFFIDNFSSLKTPNVYTLRNNAGVKIREILNNKNIENKFAALQLPEKQFFTFTNATGIELNGWILKPVNFDATKKYPVLQVQYSGPNSQQVLDRWKIDWEYYLSTQGYIVICVDGRGTGARGRDFRNYSYMKLGQVEAEDQIAAAKYMSSLPYVDKDRIGIWGWSYGGFQTLVCMSQPEQVFKAGIAVAPVTDYRFYDSAYTERYMRRPQENFKGYEATSPLEMAEQLKGNLLIVHGTADDNVHVQNTLLYINRLVEADKQFEMQIYTDENHFMRKGNSYRHLYTRMANFLSNNL